MMYRLLMDGIVEFTVVVARILYRGGQGRKSLIQL